MAVRGQPLCLNFLVAGQPVYHFERAIWSIWLVLALRFGEVRWIRGRQLSDGATGYYGVWEFIFHPAHMGQQDCAGGLPGGFLSLGFWLDFASGIKRTHGRCMVIWVAMMRYMCLPEQLVMLLINWLHVLCHLPL